MHSTAVGSGSEPVHSAHSPSWSCVVTYIVHPVDGHPCIWVMGIRVPVCWSSVHLFVGHPCTWEEGVSSCIPGGGLPILDLQCWHSNTSGTGTTIYYMFYRKPMANQQLMLFHSAMPEKTKRTTLSQEVSRILRNCHPDLPWEDKLAHLNGFIERLRDNGYPEKMRAEIVLSGLKGYGNMKETERNGGRPINRMRTL